MASQVVSPDKRYRISLLLDAYGDLLTDKQRTFLHHYYEDDLSFGEVARMYGVSRQAIFDSVKHGEEALDRFERSLRLVDSGWNRWNEMDLTMNGLLEQLESIATGQPAEAAPRLKALLARLRGDDEVNNSPPPLINPEAREA